MRNFMRLAAMVAVLLPVLVACGGDTATETTTVDVFPACSPEYPFGTCETGSVCFDGACVAVDTLCSAANPTGTCADGEACFLGGCVDESLLCSAANPGGACAAGLVCDEGTCVEPEGGTVTPTDDCGPANPDGDCPTGMECFGGTCVDSDALCSATNTTGACGIGQSCLEGACVDTASLCSSVNIEGVCPGDLVCHGGICAEPEAGEVDPCETAVYTEQPELGIHTDASGKETITVDGLEFKDLNGDGELNPYEDWRLLEICRAKDLVARMDLDQKIGVMGASSSLGSGTEDGSIPDNVVANLEAGKRYALIRLGRRTATELAIYLNNLQEWAEGADLGIPIAITADPVHGFGMSTNGQSGTQSLSASSVVSPWPYPMGLGAANDYELTKRYGEVVREEFKAMGFRWQLGPMVDLATEPRWARVQNVFGENAHHVAIHGAACIEGFQGSSDGTLRDGIAATMKHFPGAGPDEDGKDSHSRDGRFNVFPGNNFEYHQIAFQAAIDVGAAAVMPCYSIFVGQLGYDPDQVAAGFSYGLITTYLKEMLGFDGMVTGDWGTLGHGYGQEVVPIEARAARWLQAGSHQWGSDNPEYFRTAYEEGYATMDDIDGAVVKILEMGFKLGLYENPYVDADATAGIVRSDDHLMDGFNAQKMAIVMLDNRAHEYEPAATGWGAPPDTAPKYLPIDGSRYDDANENDAPDAGEYICDTNGDGVISVYFDGVIDGLVEDADNPDAVTGIVGEYDYTTAGGTDVLAIEQADTLEEADIAILRITARKGEYFGRDAGYPLSLDGPFPGTGSDNTISAGIQDRNRVIDAFRVREGYTMADGTEVEAANPDLKIVLVQHMDRPGIVEPFIQGMTTLDETAGEAGSYPLVSDPANTDPTGLSGVDAFLVEFGAFDRAVLDFIFNVNEPEGWTYGSGVLPIEIPSTDAAVEAQFEDLPADSEDPTFAIGAGSTY